MSEDILIGKKVDTAYINANKTIIKLKCGDEFLDLITEADCCSETWIEHINDFNELYGHTIVGIEKVGLGSVMGTRQECDELYAFWIKHNGEFYQKCGIEFRNSSNGFYGGWIEAKEGDDKLGGFKEIKEDF